MQERDILYYFPYRIDRERNLRQWVNNQSGYFDLVLGRHEIKHENGKSIPFRHDTHFSREEKMDNYLKFTDFCHWCKWFSGGQNIFAFSKELLKMLNQTDVGDISFDQIKLPYSTFYISLLHLGIQLDERSGEVIEGVFVSDNPHLTDGHSRIEFQFAGSFEKAYRFYSKPDLPKVYKGNFWDFSIDFDKQRQIRTIKQSLNDEIDFWKIEIFPEDKSLSEESINNILDFYNKKVSFSNEIIKLLINCLLYLSLPKEQQDINTESPNNIPQDFNKKISLSKTQKKSNQLEEKINLTGLTKINFVGDSFKQRNIKIAE